MVAGIMCLEVLVTTIIVWIGIWGLVDEALENIGSKKVSCGALILGAALLAACLQNQVTVCGLF